MAAHQALKTIPAPARRRHSLDSLVGGHVAAPAPAMRGSPGTKGRRLASLAPSCWSASPVVIIPTAHMATHATASFSVPKLSDGATAACRKKTRATNQAPAGTNQPAQRLSSQVAVRHAARAARCAVSHSHRRARFAGCQARCAARTPQRAAWAARQHRYRTPADTALPPAEPARSIGRATQSRRAHPALHTRRAASFPSGTSTL
mmetsp:Transcript_60658/g.156284  ORF Transcript_60658/g.156284 Transcript_60658/m.156284 type:complete len:205 (+) Transcript_60658:166-780(+)